MFGVVRPTYDVEKGTNPHVLLIDGVLPDIEDPRSCDGHCFFLTSGGQRYPGCEEWDGMEPAMVFESVTMVLDLDAGTMTVWKMDERLGVMATGLTGEYSWAVNLLGKGDGARVELATPEPESQPPVQVSSQAICCCLCFVVLFVRDCLWYVQLERSTWGATADALAAGIYSQCGVSDSFTDTPLEMGKGAARRRLAKARASRTAAQLDPDEDHQDNRLPVPGCADLSDEMMEQLFRQRQQQQQQQQQSSVRRQRQPAQQQQKQKKKKIPEQQVLQLGLQVRSPLYGRPSVGVTPQETHAAQAYAARQVLKPGW